MIKDLKLLLEEETFGKSDMKIIQKALMNELKNLVRL